MSYCESSSHSKETALLVVSLCTGTIILVLNYLAKQNKKLQQESMDQKELDKARQILDQVENPNTATIETSTTNGVIPFNQKDIPIPSQQ